MRCSQGKETAPCTGAHASLRWEARTTQACEDRGDRWATARSVRSEVGDANPGGKDS